ncbi:MAG: CidA/LrgA family protein [Treponema sp.]|jgi:holin-like protein|nr:CidA/LrgA family protein [Treponema sp.]
MEIIAQLGFIIGVGYAGELLARLLPVRLPAGVLGIILVFTALSLRLVKPRRFGKTADFISAQMGFFFLPLSVSVLQNYQAISPVLFQIIVICAISTLITFAASYGAVRLLRVVMEKRGRLLSGVKTGVKTRRSSVPPQEAVLKETAGREEIPPAQSGKVRE